MWELTERVGQQHYIAWHCPLDILGALAGEVFRRHDEDLLLELWATAKGAYPGRLTFGQPDQIGFLMACWRR